MHRGGIILGSTVCSSRTLFFSSPVSGEMENFRIFDEMA